LGELPATERREAARALDQPEAEDLAQETGVAATGAGAAPPPSPRIVTTTAGATDGAGAVGVAAIDRPISDAIMRTP
jgi:hypothetical protein